MNKLGRRYHREVGFPASLDMPRPGLQLVYTPHALAEARVEGLRAEGLPTRLPEAFTVIEATVFCNRTQKWLIRLPLDLAWDFVLSVTSDGMVLTVWLNQADDLHSTLRRELYDRPEETR